MITTFYIIAVILGLVGLIGSIVPILPGPMLAWGGWLLLYFTHDGRVTLTSLIVWGVMLLLLILLDNFGSTWLTNKVGGSKWGTRGCFIGMLVGMFFFPPMGLILGPFFGAFAGEIISNASTGHALKVALWSFVSFLLTTGLKLIYCGVLLFYMVKGLIGVL